MSSIEYRPELDGLRAVAVLAVLVFHLNRELLPGGFVGVDIFFVLSGFLITSVILADLEAGTFSFKRFYQRRIARIAPASLLVLAVVLVVSSMIYTSQDFASTGAVALAAALSLANVKLMLQGNYFEILPDAQPLLHFWSLAIEEQFYFVFPVLLFCGFRWCNGRRSVTALLWILGIASFAACLAATWTKPTWAFYLLPTRAWELVAGCLLAMYAQKTPVRQRQGLSRLQGATGLLIIALSFDVIHESNSFPGAIAGLPVIGTLLCIGACRTRQVASDRLLSQGWLVYVGKMSYSLYLWHWPVYCFVDYGWYTVTPLARDTAKVVLTVGLSVISYTCYEKPIRRYLNQPNKAAVAYISLACGIAAVALAGYHVRRDNYVSADMAAVENGGRVYNEHITRPSVVLMGDSIGSMYGTTLRDIAHELPFRLHVICVDGEDPLPPGLLFEKSIGLLERERPDVTVLAVAWSGKLRHRPESLGQALNEILKYSDQVLLITPPPILPAHATRESIRSSGRATITEEAESTAEREYAKQLLAQHLSDRVHLLDIEKTFVGQNGAIRFTDEFGNQLFQDRTHLSGDGAVLVKEDLRRQVLELIQFSRSDNDTK